MDNDRGSGTDWGAQREYVDGLFKQYNAGTIDFATLQAKVARRTLDQPEAEQLLNLYLVALIQNDTTAPLGLVAHLMLMRILRLEDDVRKLRAEVVKDRIERGKKGGQP